ncbi:MAG: DUF2461 domain-containing protein [Nitritalea sp.]
MATGYLEFLSVLREHNTKEWMDAHRDDYQAVRKAFLGDVGQLLEGAVHFEPGLAHLQAKDCVFRQNRDIRFSANKNPYKTNLAAYLALGGKKSEGPGYYIHLEPGASFLAVGVWMPPAPILKHIRQEIDYNGEEMQGILDSPKVRSTFSEMSGEQLKTSPKGYAADHPHITLLRFKSFILSRPISDASVQSGRFVAEALAAWEAGKPFHDFILRASEESESGEGLLPI